MSEKSKMKSEMKAAQKKNIRGSFDRILSPVQSDNSSEDRALMQEIEYRKYRAGRMKFNKEGMPSYNPYVMNKNAVVPG